MSITKLEDSKLDFVEKKLLVKSTNRTKIVAVSATITRSRNHRVNSLLEKAVMTICHSVLFEMMLFEVAMLFDLPELENGLCLGFL